MGSIDHTNHTRHKRITRLSKRRTNWRAWLLFTLLAAQTVFSPNPALSAPAPQGNDPGASAAGLLELLTPEERVGQLFLVTFQGATADDESQIYSLVNAYNIGGVVLRRDMENFVAAPDTLSAAYELISQLQRAEADSSRSSRVDPISGEEHVPSYIPLLVAISQEGDGYPNDQILDMLSPQPNAMTLGATWNPDLARQTGSILGDELAALGVNMLLGPSLDVLEDPRPESPGDLGVRSFGGDPYWVGRMGQAFIQGVHEGSENRIAVVAKHLPGYGGIDRPPDEEVPTVRKSLDQLAQVELPPFFAVTGEAAVPEMQADAMLLAHIRYQGFQGNIRDTTSPISFDPQAFSELMALPAFAVWRQAGGLMVSDSLGVRAIRRNFDSTEQVFNSPFVARDAFLAGNDLLYLGNFLASGDPDQYTSIVRTIEFFAQKYREDQAFAERVDESVLRILTLKYTLYPSFILNRIVPEADLTSIGSQEDVFFEIGREAATLFSPSPAELPSVLPAPPGPFEQIIFISDSYAVQQCIQCEPEFPLAAGTLAQSMLQLYGPGTATQFSAANVASFFFSQLARTLDNTVEGEDPLLANIPRAEWIVFGLLKEETTRSDSFALRRLLAERPDLIAGKKVIVFALNAPYYLDATDLTRISAYYGLYSKNDQIADVAARLLFREIGAPGSSPVSVEGIGYSLIDAISPDPTRTITLQVSRILPVPEEGTPETNGPGQPTYQAGDLLNLVAGPILDHNGHVVPDGTPLIFYATIISEGSTAQQQVAASTSGGVAQANFAIGQEGSLEIFASSGDPQARSDTLRFDVVGINPEGLALQATQTAQAELLVTPSPQPTQFAFDPEAMAALGRTDILDWFLLILISAVGGVFVYQVGMNMGRVRWAVRWGLATLIGGLAVGSYLSLGLPGSREVLLFGGEWGLVLSVLMGCAVGWGVGLLWREMEHKNLPNGRS